MSTDRLTKNAIFIARNYFTSEKITTAEAEKMFKELSSDKRKLLIHILKTPQSSDQSKIDEIDELLEEMINKTHDYKRKTNLRLWAIRSFKNQFLSRISSEKLAKEILKINRHSANPSQSTSCDLSKEELRQEACVKLLGNLSKVILEQGFYLNEGFLRIPGSSSKVKTMHNKLLEACSNQSVLTSSEILKISEKISMDPDDYAGVFKMMARDLLEPESHLYVDYTAGLISDDPMNLLPPSRKPKNLKEILIDDIESYQNVMTLLNAVTENQYVTRLDEGALMAAFPACRCLFHNASLEI